MFGRMKIYTVHVKPDAPRPLEQPVFVREGFNFYAFLFHFLWAFYHRLWIAGALIMAAYILLGILAELHILGPSGLAVMQLALLVVIGFHANDWLRIGLARRGYIMTDVAAGDSLLTAEQRYFERYLSAAH